MKKLLVAIPFFLLLIIPSFVLADDDTNVDVTTNDASVEVTVRNQVNTTESARQEIRQQIRSDREEMRQEMEQKREEIREKISTARKLRINNFFDRSVARVEALITRLENLISRMESRIAKIKEADPTADTSSAEEDIAEAKTKIAEAKDKLAEAQTELETTLESDTPREEFKAVIELFQGIRSDLQDVHTLLTHAIGELKGLRIGTTKVDSTPDTNNEE